MSSHTLFLTNNGEVYGCGNNNYYQLGNNKNTDIIYHLDIDFSVTQVGTGRLFSAFICTNGNLYIMGKMQSYTKSIPTLIPDIYHITKMKCTPYSILVLNNENSLFLIETYTSYIKYDFSFKIVDMVHEQGIIILLDEIGNLTYINGNEKYIIPYDETSPKIISLSSSFGCLVFLDQYGNGWKCGITHNSIPTIVIENNIPLNNIYCNSYNEIYTIDCNNNLYIHESGDIIPHKICTDVIYFNNKGSLSYFVKSDGSVWITSDGIKNRFSLCQFIHDVVEFYIPSRVKSARKF